MYKGYLGHHKCGSTWIKHILIDLIEDFQEILNREEDFNKDFIVFRNATISQARKLEKGFHVVRDPRDVVVSAYFSHLNSWDSSSIKLRQQSKLLKKLSFHHGLIEIMDILEPFYFSRLKKWDFNQRHILEIKFEDIIETPVNYFTHIIDFLEMKTSKGVKEVIEKNKWENKSGRDRGTEDRRSHWRKGIVGDWKNYFNKSHCRYFKRRWNDVLFELGYEDIENWETKVKGD